MPDFTVNTDDITGKLIDGAAHDLGITVDDLAEQIFTIGMRHYMAWRKAEHDRAEMQSFIDVPLPEPGDDQ